MTDFSRGLAVAALALGLMVGAMVSRARAQESHAEFWASQGVATGQGDVAMPKGRRGRSSRVLAPAGPTSGVAAYAAQFVGRSGPSLGLPSRLWCQDFAMMVLRATGHRTVASRRAVDAARVGPRIPGPQVGALAINGRRCGAHVSIVAAVYSDGSFLAINGNGRGRRVTESVRYGELFVMPERG